MLEFSADAAPHAFVFDVGVLQGVLVQPTSNYYHSIYGAYLGAATAAEKLSLQAGYLERPTFRADGFADKEWAYYFMADAKLAETTSRKFGVVGGMGWTRLGGYIKPDKTGANGTLPSRQFIIDGPGAALEVYARVWGMRLSVAHQTFIGFASAMQTSAYVAWPYNFLMIKAGMSIE